MTISVDRFLRSFGRGSWSVALGVLLLLSALIFTQAGPGAAQPRPRPHPVRVTGTLKLVVQRAPTAVGFTSALIALPDQKVFLRSAAGTAVASAVTQLDGRFDVMAPGSGTYSVCWEIADQTGCAKQILVGKTTTGAQDVLARVERPILFGTSLTGDDRPCWINDSFFGLDVSTAVAAGGRKVRANIRGEYAIVGLAPGPYDVKAACEHATASAHVTLAGLATRADLPLPNHAPRLVTVYATDGAKSVARPAVGASVKLVAASRDPDGDTIEYLWRTNDDGALAGAPGPTQQWTLPASAGLNAAYVIARDGKGGYAFRRFELRSGSPDLAFSGQVVDEVSHAPIGHASVTVAGGAPVATDANGWFSLTSPPRSDDRYVLNVTHPDYARMSRVYDKDAVGNTYELIRAQVQTLPVNGIVSITDTRSSGPCGTGKADDRVRPLVRLVGPTVYRPDIGQKMDKPQAATRARSPLAAAAQTPRCDPRGVQISIPAGGLVYGGTNAPVGAIHSASATLNPARRAIPGDYQALPAAGGRAELLSYGALYARFTDSAGHELNLKSGASAEIRVPVSDEARPTAPPTIALWSYDGTRGVWIEEGNAPLQNTPQGWFYVGHTTHFSELNMDVAGFDPAHATCVRVEVGPDFTGWSNLTMRAYVSYGGAPPPKVKETALDNHQYHAIFRIPFHTGFPNSLRIELRGQTPGGLQQVLLDNIINTDAPPHHAMTTADLWPDPPYTDCTPVVLTAAPGVVPPYGDIDGFGRPAFLAGPSGAFNPADGDAQATAYYAALDTPVAKPNLGAWWGANNFNATTGLSADPSFVQAAYLNHNDLGFGRNMHCVRNGPKLACYVTNYGLPDQNPQNSIDARDQVNPGATVAMEYDPGATGSEQVQFFVYGAGATAASGRLKFADLDGFGPKPVPFLCQTCHGGEPFLNADHKVDNAHFREFDLPSFRYPGDISWDYGVPISATTPSAADFQKFGKLNQMVRDSNAGDEIANVINGWYPANFNGRPVEPPPPPGWAGHASDYRAVYGTTCRTCHIARSYPDFVSAGGLGRFQDPYVVGKVCGTGPSPRVRVMPNSSITYRNFWAEAARVHLYEALVGIAADSCGA